MNNAKFVRTTGIAGVFGAVLWLVSLFIEYAYGLFSCEGALCGANQAMSVIAQLCYLAVIGGLMRSGAAGDGWFGRISVWLFFFGWVALACGGLASALGLPVISDGPVADVVILIGAIASTLGGFLTGVAVVVARHFRGFWRFAPLIQGLYQLGAFLRIILASQEPTQLTESLWTGTWFLMGLALFASAAATTGQRSSVERPSRALHSATVKQNQRGGEA